MRLYRLHKNGYKAQSSCTHTQKYQLKFPPMKWENPSRYSYDGVDITTGHFQYCVFCSGDFSCYCGNPNIITCHLQFIWWRQKHWHSQFIHNFTLPIKSSVKWNTALLLSADNSGTFKANISNQCSYPSSLHWCERSGSKCSNFTAGLEFRASYVKIKSNKNVTLTS